mmetsp:Transcript_21339/g.54500  ORF Transcript_21339/g.54500 Transcript_21339/m.54500 type:complete len:259 (+) Transcript_21339:1467-2243(+)
MKWIRLLVPWRECRCRTTQPRLHVRKVRSIHHRRWDVRRIWVHFPIRIPIAHRDGIGFANCSRKHDLCRTNESRSQVLCCHRVSHPVCCSNGCPRGFLVGFDGRAAPGGGLCSSLDLLQNLGLRILPEGFTLSNDRCHVILSLSFVYSFVLLPLGLKSLPRRLPSSPGAALRFQPRNGPHGLVRSPQRRGLGGPGHHGIGPPCQSAFAQAGEHGHGLLGAQRWEVREAGELGTRSIRGVAEQLLCHQVALGYRIGCCL